MSEMIECAACGGTGDEKYPPFVRSGWLVCAACDGKGEYYVITDFPQYEIEKCETCNGTGKVERKGE